VPQANGNSEYVKELLSILFDKEVWEKSEVEELCKRKGLKYNVAIEEINDYAYSVVEDSVIEEDGGQIYVTTDYRKEML